MRSLIQSSLIDALQRAQIAAYRYLGSVEEARDACQEAATRALSAASQYDAQQPFYPWFYRILKNHCLDRLRRRKHDATGDLDALSAPDSSAEKKMAMQQSILALHSAIASLPEEMREIIELRHFQDLSYEEIGTVLSLPQGTVMSRLYRARKALREELKQRGESGIPTGGQDA